MPNLEALFKEKNRLWLTEEEIKELNLTNEERQTALFYHPDSTLYWKTVTEVEPEWVERNLASWMYV